VKGGASGVSIAALVMLLAGGVGRAEPPIAPGPLRLSWDEALRRALAQNPSVVVAGKEIERAAALVREARAGWLPTLTATGANTRLDADRTSGGAVTTPASVWNATLRVDVPIVAPLAWTGEAHARDNVAVAATDAQDVRRQIAAAVARAYLTVLLNHRQIEVAARARDVAGAHFDYTHERLERGLGNALDDA
jgi:outer membrane protein TolC